MVEELPSFIPHVLRRDEVCCFELTRACSTLRSMDGELRCSHAALAVDTIKGRCGIVSRSVEFTNDYPWQL